jgi:hypothetical protein
MVSKAAFSMFRYCFVEERHVNAFFSSFFRMTFSQQDLPYAQSILFDTVCCYAAMVGTSDEPFSTLLT